MGLLSGLGNMLGSAVSKVGDVGKSAVGGISGLAGKVGDLQNALPGMKQANDLKSHIPGADTFGSFENPLATNSPVSKLNTIAGMYGEANGLPSSQDLTPGSIPSISDLKSKLPRV